MLGEALSAERLAKVPRPEPGTWLTHERSGEMLSLSPDALYRAVAAGEIPRDRIYGDVYRYSRREIERVVATRPTPPSTTTGANGQDRARPNANAGG